MNNNKDLSEQLGDLFDELSLDQAGNLIDNEIAPSKAELQEEVIENIKKSNIKIDKKILSELKSMQDNGEDKIVDYLRETYGLKYTEEVKEELESDLEVVEPEPVQYKKETPEVKAESYIDSLGDRLANVLNKTGMRTRTERKEAELTESLEARVDAIQSQLGLLRTSMMEAAGNTIVSGIGQGGDGQTPGSGETRLNRLDDVHIPLKTSTTRSIAPAGLSGESRYEIEDGSVLVWDSSIYPDGGWTVVPGDEIGGGGIDEIADVEPVFGKIWNGNTFNTEATLYFGTNDQFVADTTIPTDPTLIPDAEGEVVAENVLSFSYVVSTDAEEFNGNNGVYNTIWYIVGAKNAVGTPLGVKTAYHTPVLSTTQDIIEVDDPDPDSTTGKLPIYGAYFRDGVDGNVIDPDENELDGLIVGHLTGCRETAGPAVMYWGTTDDYSYIVENGVTPGDSNITPVLTGGGPTIAEKIISCVGKVVEDLLEDDAGNKSPGIQWQIVYADAEGGIRTTEYDAGLESNEVQFEGPFLYAASAPCVSGSLSRVRTDDVYLAKIDDLTTTFNEIRDTHGSLPIDLTQFEYQEDYNELVAEILLDLHKIKPTMLVAAFEPVDPDIDESVPDYTVEGIHDLYVPIEGDLWFDPADNTLRAVKNVTYVNRPGSGGRPEFTAEWVVISANDTEVSTREVTLFNTLAAYEYFKQYRPDLTEEQFFEFFPLQTQEDLNIFNLDLLTQLKENKPTIHVCPNIFEVTDTITTHKKSDTDPWDGNWEAGDVDVMYIPKQGDIWVKSDTYTIYVADIRNDKGNPVEHPSFDVPDPRNGNPNYPYTDGDGNYLFWVEVGGGGEGGNKVYIQTDPPTNVYKGDLWVEDTTYYVYVYQGETWVALTGDASALGKNFSIHVSDNMPPANPETGDCWFSRDDTELRIFILDMDGTGNSGWFPVSSGGISINKFEEYQTKSYLNYQIQDLNARLAALESAQTSSVNDGSNYTYPMIDEDVTLQTNIGYDVLDNINDNVPPYDTNNTDPDDFLTPDTY